MTIQELITYWELMYETTLSNKENPATNFNGVDEQLKAIHSTLEILKNIHN